MVVPEHEGHGAAPGEYRVLRANSLTAADLEISYIMHSA